MAYGGTRQARPAHTFHPQMHSGIKSSGVHKIGVAAGLGGAAMTIHGIQKGSYRQIGTGAAVQVAGVAMRRRGRR